MYKEGCKNKQNQLESGIYVSCKRTGLMKTLTGNNNDTNGLNEMKFSTYNQFKEIFNDIFTSNKNNARY